MKNERNFVSPNLEGHGSFANEIDPLVPKADPIEIFPGAKRFKNQRLGKRP